MANIVEIGEISTAFACYAAYGDESDLTPAELDKFNQYVAGAQWYSVQGDGESYGRCEITGLSSTLITLIGDYGAPDPCPQCGLAMDDSESPDMYCESCKVDMRAYVEGET